MKWLINWRDWDPETGPAVTGERGWGGGGGKGAWLPALGNCYTLDFIIFLCRSWDHI